METQLNIEASRRKGIIMAAVGNDKNDMIDEQDSARSVQITTMHFLSECAETLTLE